jgi:tyrosine-protein phosphatase YwqE
MALFDLFRKKDSSNTGELFSFRTDIHSHILPGVDDGAPDVETTVTLVRGLYDLGFRKCIATPHIIGDLYRNTPETIAAALDKAQAAVAAAGIPMEISAAAEYMLDDHFMQLLNTGTPLLTLHKNILLTEFSYSIAPANIEELAFNILTNGYLPVLAHPERYPYFHQRMEDYNRLDELGFRLQVNLLSLTGYYGKAPAKAAAYILNEGLASLVGTDMHHQRHLDALKHPEHRAIFQRYLGHRKFNELDDILD